jgi:hypothetical protein
MLVTGQGVDAHLQVDERLGGQTGNRSGANVIKRGLLGTWKVGERRRQFSESCQPAFAPSGVSLGKLRRIGGGHSARIAERDKTPTNAALPPGSGGLECIGAGVDDEHGTYCVEDQAGTATFDISQSMTSAAVQVDSNSSNRPASCARSAPSVTSGGSIEASCLIWA